MHTLIVLIGPTGVGKTELSLSLAEFLRSPIINADSRQIFRALPIGTAAPTPAERQRVRHYFVGTLELTDYYSAARFEEDVLNLLRTDTFSTRPAALMTGGSMLYIDAVCHGIDDIPTVDDTTRSFLKKLLAEKGLDALCSELRLRDPEYYAVADLRNAKRVVHALEICYMTGRTYTSFRCRTPRPRPFRVVKIGLRRDRDELYARINSRVDRMMADGLEEEARAYYPLRYCNALNTVGYKELFDYFDGTLSRAEAVEKIKQHSRIYSRKQMTWFKRDPEIAWFHPDSLAEIKKYVASRLQQNGEITTFAP